MITPESSNEFPWIAVWRLVKPNAIYCVDILKAHWLRPAFAESYRLLRLTLSKELVDVMFEMHLISGITDGWQGCETHRPPAKRNVKTRPLPCLYFGICYSFDFSRLLFFAFFGLFSSDFGFLYSRSIPDLVLFLSECWPVGSFQLSFSLA